MTTNLETAAARLAGPDRETPGRPIPHVVAWNLTRRCNLACAHCYISAGSWHAADGELATADCLRIVDEILAVNPSPMLILSGGEPLLRDDLEAIAERAAAGGATVVVGTNGTRLTDARIGSLMAAGVRGVAVSIDSLDPVYHDRFRHGTGALSETTDAVERLRARGLDFIVQTTVTKGNRDEIPRIAEWSAERGAVAFNVYFLVATGRGEGMKGLSAPENEAVLEELVALERRFRGRMLVRSKCMPAIMRLVRAAESDSPLLAYATRCPCGVQYCRITPEGKVTPCPYTPVVAGDLTEASFGEVWERSPVFAGIRGGGLGGRCGRCGYREVCGGCRARAYAETGDLLAEDPGCGYEPDGVEDALPRAAAVTYGEDAPCRLAWSPEAEARMARAPSFVRGVVAARVEKFAAERGYDRVTPEVLDEVRSAMPVDFSKAKPFFLREDPPMG
ncbi:MAG TPA: radical SAM protein [Gemmatimonadota bacterium]|nr:radical SAM protein [Gemmatimonadota bacterium]